MERVAWEQDEGAEGEPVSPEEARAIAEYYALLEQYEAEEAEALAAEERMVAAHEAVLQREALENDLVWMAGIRYVWFERKDGSEVALLTIGSGRARRAMVIRDDEPRPSKNVHPNQRCVRALGVTAIHPDLVADEVLQDTPELDRSGEELAKRAMNNWQVFNRYREALRASGVTQG